MKSDIVVMNPPFGTKRKNADREFLQAAFTIAEETVYSLHKTSTRSFIHSFASKFVVKWRLRTCESFLDSLTQQT